MTVTSAVPTPFIVSAPGKVIIFGEHSAVFNKNAIAASVSSLRTYLLIEQSKDGDGVELDFPDINYDSKWSTEELKTIDSEVVKQAAGLKHLCPKLKEQLNLLLEGLKDSLNYYAALSFLYLYLSLCPNVKGLKFTVKSTLPIGAGLGSSASISVCLALAMARMGGHISCDKSISQEEKEFINHWAFIGECCIHGTPSGIDNAVATYGNAVKFKRQEDGSTKFDQISNFPQLPMVLTNTRIKRSTKILVSGVGDLVNRKPLITEPILEAMNQVALRGSELLSDISKDIHYDELLELIRINHGLLVAIGVSHPGLEVIKQLSDELKIGQTKLTGAGGGGCAFTLLNKDVDHSSVRKFHEKLHSNYGYQIFETGLGGVGCCFVDLKNEQYESLKHLFIDSATVQEVSLALLPSPDGSLTWTA
ncbi:mevalonate kinase [Kluyveromyces lactis]|uniref:Mevalonate kinase n=1 Tax=Kluyveromyces lactis (strain ATCC 8585 / CBS 2359 / DSM 70799 / NBRC 1267 / NRRL Y-1140 / WM37) TaxID=284590 RepID=Q6CU57_KLULA|nr:uncharacterized protein KLLA0_C07469g [Kluyveromyces lactis]CAH01383.1 KLLA0C07469p [Kluyveromyces lactis]|eukprot:XP_452532.1 uncharacterized protein KLLA0_C07469g [Kluyveromyces lactis]